MSDPLALIAAWARSPVTPLGGALSGLLAHEMAAPVVQALLARAGLDAQAVDAIVVGNALGAGGNPARMLSLAAGLPMRCAAYSVDTQCCSGLDAMTLAVGLLASGQASVVIAGGVEAWSRAPIRQVRPRHAGEHPVTYEQPAFAPDPARDPDVRVSAADYAQASGINRAQQDAYAVLSHQTALAGVADLSDELVEVAGCRQDTYPRALDAGRAARMPVALQRLAHVGDQAVDCSVSRLAISAKADGAAFVLLATPQACQRLGITARAAWVVGTSVGGDSRTPLLVAEQATRLALQRAGIDSLAEVQVRELHDAFAVQGLSYCQAFGLDPLAINRRGGGLARGHPIAASGTIAMVRVLSDLCRDHGPGARGLAAVAGAGGIGAAAVVSRL